MRILDLFCGAGGAAMGMHQAMPDAEIVGVDIVPQPRYPFAFVQADAMTFPLDGFDFVWASPPCQDHMRTPHRKHGTGWMLDGTRDRLIAHGGAWVIENVAGAALRADFRICGCMVGLPLRRERWFETSWNHFALHPSHLHTGPVVSVVGHGTPSWVRKALGYNPTIHQYRAAMGIDWMNRNELSQAIPPAYSRYILEAYAATLKEPTPCPER